MSTRHDRNYLSFDSQVQSDAAEVTARPSVDGWARGSWQDTVKFHKRVGCKFEHFRIEEGGTEDAVDINNGCRGNEFRFFRASGDGARVLTLKGGSQNNLLSDWFITQPGRVVDVEIGGWSSYNRARCTGNQFCYWQRSDGLPVTWCARWGCRPEWVGTHTKHLWGRSLGLTLFWWGKYLWHDVLRRPDN